MHGDRGAVGVAIVTTSEFGFPRGDGNAPAAAEMAAPEPAASTFATEPSSVESSAAESTQVSGNGFGASCKLPSSAAADPTPS